MIITLDVQRRFFNRRHTISYHQSHGCHQSRRRRDDDDDDDNDDDEDEGDGDGDGDGGGDDDDGDDADADADADDDGDDDDSSINIPSKATTKLSSIAVSAETVPRCLLSVEISKT